MFTGIVQDIGRVQRIERRDRDVRLTIATSKLHLEQSREGDSIAVAGVCLTALEITPESFAADVSLETLRLTTLGELGAGSRVNLEPALRAGDALGGHLVSGHVDGMGIIAALEADARSTRVRCTLPAELAKYVARKGSITLDGVSLTVNDVDGTHFGVNLIPHTQAVTTLGEWRVGQRVNVEVDTIARYVERLLGDPR
jgi:riboflavin synthase